MSTDPNQDYVTRRFLVSGRVQGVHFRHSTRLEAQRLGVGGVARNLPDGCVEVFAHGAKAAVDALLIWLGKGPPLARVAAVEELQAPAEGTVSPMTDAKFSVE